MSDWVAIQQALQNWVCAASGLSDASVVWSQQPKARPPAAGDNAAIMLRISNIAEIGLPEEAIQDNPITFAAKTVTLVDVSGNALTIPTHGFNTGTGPIVVESTTDDPPAPLVEAMNYWAIVLDANRIRLADTFEKTGGGDASNPVTPIVLTDVGTGTLTVNPTDETVRAGEEILEISRSLLRVTLELRCHSGKGVGNNMATSVLQKVRSRRVLSSVRQILKAANITLLDVERVQAILGIRDALLFEPRAYLNVHVGLLLSESEAQTIISSVEITDLMTGKVTTVPSDSISSPWSNGFSSGFGG